VCLRGDEDGGDDGAARADEDYSPVSAAWFRSGRGAPARPC
jgi:hypothetical protein